MLKHSKKVITLATRNEGKRLELEHWLQTQPDAIELRLNLDVDDIEETGASFLENALIKAQATPPVATGGWVLAEDSGLGVDALDGLYGLSPFPGLKSNRWLTPALRDTLLGQAYPNRMPLDRMTETGVSNSDLCYAILALMKNQKNRLARYYCGMTLWNPATGSVIEALESTELWVTEGEPTGTQGFGYDPIMHPLEAEASGLPSAYTVAALSPAEKNKMSHRGKAFRKILSLLRERE